MIQSLRRGLEIIDFMATRGGEASVSEAARFLGVDRSTSSRVLSTLEGKGYVEQDAETQRYRLGTRLLQLSAALLESLHLGSLGRDEVHALAEQTGEGAQLAVLSATDAIFIEHADGREALTISTNVGDRDPIYCTAIGRALLSTLPDWEVRDRLSRVHMERYTRKTVTSIDQVLDALRLVRMQGYAFDDEERHAGVQCVAAPVFDHTGRCVAAIGISGPTPRMMKATEAAVSSAVLASARSLSGRLGFSPQTARTAGMAASVGRT